MMETFPCISLWQPWASAPFLEIDGERLKVHETRSWAPPSKFIGKRIAIHAAKRSAPAVLGVVDTALQLAAGDGWRATLPRGCVVGTAILAGAFRMPHDTQRFVSSRYPGFPASVRDLHFGDWTPGRWAWRLDDPRPLAEPVPMLGRQGWFSVEIDTP
jgi:hypothetical protein